jgi:hypothetical protein
MDISRASVIEKSFEVSSASLKSSGISIMETVQNKTAAKTPKMRLPRTVK